MKTQEQVTMLIHNWLSDPCWNIEDTEGFEEHYEDLKAYRLGMEATWSRIRYNEIDQKATELRCSFELAEHLFALEQRVSQLKDEIRLDY